jgi:hypothetical protein
MTEPTPDHLAVPPATAAIGALDEAPPSARAIGRHAAVMGAMIFIAVALACVVTYLIYAVPGPWFPRAQRLLWGAQNLALTRGTGDVADRRLVVSKPDATGLALVSVTTDFRASDYPAIEWLVSGLGEGADVRLLWRSDYRPDRLNSVTLRVEAGRSLPAVLAKNPAWIGRVSGLALAIHDPLAQPAYVLGVVAKPMGAAELLRDRVGEWLAFERWNGASINTVTGGADVQDLPLPAFLAAVALVSGVIGLVAVRRRSPGTDIGVPTMVASFFLIAWLVLDTRWTWNLLRQERVTVAQYWGKDDRERLLAGEDAPVYTFVDKALQILPKDPVRVFVAADADYFRGRAAYHLYPHNVYFSPRGNALPPASSLRAGDWLLVFLRRGVQFDRTNETIRWDDNQTAKAELRLVEPGAALFRIR